MKVIDKAEKVVYTILMSIGGVFMLAAMAVVAINVIYRSIAGAPITGYYELTGWLSAYFCAIAIAVTTLRKQHVRVDILTNHLPYKPYLVLEYIAHIFELLLAAFIFAAAAKYGWRMFTTGEATQTLRFPIWPARFVWALSMLLIVIIKVIHIARTKSDVQTKFGVKSKPANEQENTEEGNN